MFQVLLESRAPAAKRAGWTAASTLVHGTLVAMGIVATVRTATSTPPEPKIPDLVYAAVIPEPPPRAASPSIALPGATIGAITPPTIPVFDPAATIIRDDFGLTVGEPTAHRIDEMRPAIAAGGVHTPHTVDRMVLPHAGNPNPEYPAQLRASAVEGEVHVRFVVDSTGRVELPTIQIVQATHTVFGDAVRRWLVRTRYFPAEVRGQPVRQLVEQRVGFTLTR